MRLRTIIVDDEPMARDGIGEELAEVDFIEVIGKAENALQARYLISALRPDLVILDIEMPEMNGLELIKSLQDPPLVILLTAYPEYALAGYELDVMDYLIKPVDLPRLVKACGKARDFHALKKRAGRGNDYFFIKCDGRQEKILFGDLLFVKAADNYIYLYTTSRRLMVYQTLKHMESVLPAAHFMKVHKSFIIALDKVSLLEGNMLLIGKHRIPVSWQLKEMVRERVLQ